MADPEHEQTSPTAHRWRSLLELQDLDVAIHQLEHRRSHLPELAELRALEADEAAEATTVAELEERQSALVATQRNHEAEIASSQLRLTNLEAKMASAQGAAARDLQAIDHEVSQLRGHIAASEDAELEVLEELEPIETELRAARGRSESRALERSAIRQRGAAAVAALDVELAEHRGRRTALVAGVDPVLLARYDQIRSKLGVVAVARLNGARCEGCHLELSSVEVDRLRKLDDDALVSCDNCGRLLVRASQLR